MSVDLVIFANKYWEALPLVHVLGNPDASPVSGLARKTPSGRGRHLRLESSDCSVEVWCLENLMKEGVNESSTYEKSKSLRQWRVSPRAVLAFGTGALPNSRVNGNVVVGTSVFVHDPYTANRKSPPSAENWVHGDFDRLIRSNAAHLIESVDSEAMAEATKRLLRPKIGGATTLKISVDPENVALSSVNVTDRSHYSWTDKSALKCFEEVCGKKVPLGSVETTHGFLRLMLGDCFLFVTGIANEVGKHKRQVVPNRYAQNFVAAHNAAIAVAWLLPNIIKKLSVH